MTWRTGPLVVGLIAVIALSACDRSDDEPTDQSPPTSETTMNTQALTDALSSEFTSANGAFRLSHPSAWIVEETFDDGAVVLANQQAALDRYMAGSSPVEGDLVLHVGFLPASLFQQRELARFEISVDAAPDVFLRSTLPALDIASGAELGDIDLVSFGGRQAGRSTVQSPDREGVIVAFPAGDGVAGLVSTVTAAGESARFEEVVSQIVESVAYEGDEGALYGRLLTG
ncbi:MAG: hypothetical protein OEX04_05430 [Acidimicrobiia bacterium]|nr:hypothetical protein [Acidimicrobiia bacterium]MDH4306900.1 hypothetical protein [Acidimicrobiia bacterium]